MQLSAPSAEHAAHSGLQARHTRSLTPSQEPAPTSNPFAGQAEQVEQTVSFVALHAVALNVPGTDAQLV